jgi:hypothetical protein
MNPTQKLAIEVDRYESRKASLLFMTPVWHLVVLDWIDHAEFRDNAIGLEQRAAIYLDNDVVRAKLNARKLFDFLRDSTRSLIEGHEAGKKFKLPMYGGTEEGIQFSAAELDELCQEALSSARACLNQLKSQGNEFPDHRVASIMFVGFYDAILRKLKADVTHLFDRVDQNKLFEPFTQP